jgi:hypothetical protein
VGYFEVAHYQKASDRRERGVNEYADKNIKAADEALSAQ